jgi:hypothetical protein
LVLLSDGTIKATGYNGSGQVGDGSFTQRTSAVAVSSLTNVVAIAAKYDHSLALRSDGTVYAWGYNGHGQIGDGTTTNRGAPLQITALSSIAKIGVGHYHSVAVSSTGVVSTWGSNTAGQLGDGTTTSRSTPSAISDSDYDWKVGTPMFSVATGTYNTDRTVQVTIDTAGATIYYTRNGDEPTQADATITAGSSLTISYTQTLKAKAWKSGMPPE